MLRAAGGALARSLQRSRGVNACGGLAPAAPRLAPAAPSRGLFFGRRGGSGDGGDDGKGDKSDEGGPGEQVSPIRAGGSTGRSLAARSCAGASARRLGGAHSG